MNRTRTAIILAVLMFALVSVPQFEAREGGIDKDGDNGCGCHGDATSATNIAVDGLPDVFNVSETYVFTVTITNDDVEGTSGGLDRAGGFRIWVDNGVGTLESVPDEQGNVAQEMDGALTHTGELNSVRSWTFQWTAPADDTAIATFKIYSNK